MQHAILVCGHRVCMSQAEDSKISMDSGRRRQSLQAVVDLVNVDMDREQKSLDGVQRLVEVYRDKPTFSDSDTREEVNQRCANVCWIFVYLHDVYDTL